MHYMIYARVSPKGSDWAAGETSIPDQVAQCRAYIGAIDPGATVEVVIDELVSAASTDRPAYRRLVWELDAGVAEWDVLVVRHIDRLSRSLGDAMDILRLLQSNGKGLVSTTQRLDLSTPTGRAMLHIILVFAEWEREMGRERTKMKMVSIARSGCWPGGRTPLGYRRVAKHDNVLQIDQRNADVVRRLFVEYVAGESTNTLGRRYGLGKKRVIGILRNRTYIGKVDYDGEVYDGKHAPIIPESLFWRVQEMLPGSVSASRPAAQKYTYLLAGLVRCECGYAMTPASANGNGGRYYYYQCVDCRERVSAPKLERMMVDRLGAITFDHDDMGSVQAAIESRFAAAKLDCSELEEYETALRDAIAERDRIKDLFVKGLVTESNAIMINHELTKRVDEVNRLAGRIDAIKAMNDPNTRALFDAQSWAASVVSFADTVGCLSPAEQRELIKTCVREIKKMGTTWQVAFSSALSGSSNRYDWLPEGELVEPVVILKPGGVALAVIGGLTC